MSIEIQKLKIIRVHRVESAEGESMEVELEVIHEGEGMAPVAMTGPFFVIKVRAARYFSDARVGRRFVLKLIDAPE